MMHPTQWKIQTQGGTETSYSATWTSSTGTAGSDATLTREKSVTLEDGKDAIVTYRVTFTDENGASKTISGAVSMANMTSLTKTIRIPAVMATPTNDTKEYDAAAGYLTVLTEDVSQTFMLATVLPIGVTLTAARARGYWTGAGDVVSVGFRQIEDISVTSLGSTSQSTTGWNTESVVLNQLVGDGIYTAFITLEAAVGSGTVRLAWIEYEYIMPSYDKAL